MSNYYIALHKIGNNKNVTRKRPMEPCFIFLDFNGKISFYYVLKSKKI